MRTQVSFNKRFVVRNDSKAARAGCDGGKSMTQMLFSMYELLDEDDFCVALMAYKNNGARNSLIRTMPASNRLCGCTQKKGQDTTFFCTSPACPHVVDADRFFGCADCNVMPYCSKACHESDCRDHVRSGECEPGRARGCGYWDCRNDPAEATQTCTRCLIVSYCGPECQRLAWPFHKVLCRRSSVRRLPVAPADANIQLAESAMHMLYGSRVRATIECTAYASYRVCGRGLVVVPFPGLSLCEAARLCEDEALQYGVDAVDRPMASSWVARTAKYIDQDHATYYCQSSVVGDMLEAYDSQSACVVVLTMPDRDYACGLVVPFVLRFKWLRGKNLQARVHQTMTRSGAVACTRPISQTVAPIPDRRGVIMAFAAVVTSLARLPTDAPPPREGMLVTDIARTIRTMFHPYIAQGASMRGSLTVNDALIFAFAWIGSLPARNANTPPNEMHIAIRSQK